MADISITADPFIVTTNILGSSYFAILPYRNPELDQTFYITNSDIEEHSTITLSITGTWINVGIIADPFIVTTSIEKATGFDGVIIVADPFIVTFSPASSFAYTEDIRKNWVKWSNIGSLDFTLGRDNVAGERPMEWKGWIYTVKKLVGKIVVYGENGVAYLSPSGVLWGLGSASRIGIKGKGAVCGSDFIHLYVDRLGRLCKVTPESGIEVLGYDEFLGTLLSTITMSYDELNQRVYICDGLDGYVYSIKDNSLGEGPANVTGIGYQDGVLAIVAKGAVSIDPFEICSDIYDMGNRKNKTIQSIEVGTDASNALYVAIDYRLNKASAFATSPWVRVNPNGVTPLPCFGVEFRFRLKMLSYEQFELDYLRINGITHNYSYLDSFSRA
jgi:hypothetical protein